jgi:molybdopterin molybdotransferase
VAREIDRLPPTRTVTAEELAAPLVPYEDAVREVLAVASTLPRVHIPILDAIGCASGEAVVAADDVPPFASSAMDGYAIRSADSLGAGPSRPAVLRLVEDLPAGAAPTRGVDPGTASKIMTGAPVPPGADAVVPWEDTQARPGAVAVLVEVPPAKNVRPKGEDVPAGTQIIAPGDVLGPIHAGVLASLGRAEVLAVRRPRVAVLSTGDELVAPGGTLRGGQIFESNSFLIAGLVQNEGAEVGTVATIRDEPEAIASWLKRAASEHDLVVTSGGASVGEHDWLRDILTREGELKMWRVAIKPGKPIAFGSIGGTRVFSLPGNPGSAFVGMHVFVAPFVRALAGREPAPRWFTAPLASGVRGSKQRTLFCRVKIEDGKAVPLPAQSSVVLSNLLPTEAFAIVPPGGLPEGAPVRVEPLLGGTR